MEAVATGSGGPAEPKLSSIAGAGTSRSRARGSFGLSAALLEELTVKGGAIQQLNFYDYFVLRMSDVPEIHTTIIASDNPPMGVGEIGVVTVAPAIANGIYPPSADVT